MIQFLSVTYNRVLQYVRIHKKISFGVGIVLLVGVYSVFFTGSSSGETRYIITSVQKGTISTTVTGTGQVSASNQIDLKSKVSGDIVSLPVITGQEVTAGDLILQVDSRDAAMSLESAQISLEKLIQPADDVSILQARNSIESAKESNKKAIDDLAKSYDDGFNTVANAFLDIPDIMTGLKDLFYSDGGYLSDQKVRYSTGQVGQDYRDAAEVSFDTAKASYDTVLVKYKSLNRTSSTTSIESLIMDTYDMVRATAQAVKDSKNAVDYIVDQQSDKNRASGVSAQSDLSGWTSKTNSHLSSLLSTKNSIINLKDTIASSSRTLSEKTASLQKLLEGADALDIRSQQLVIQQKQNALNDYYLRAPFDGVIAKLSVKKGDSVSGSTSIGTFITRQKVADISLNEVDVSKVKTGQKVTLTFDAIDDFTITGQVVEVDLVGTVSQGVVSYNVKIGFDAQDDRIKSGMSVSASIITETKQDVLVVPNASIKSQSGISYVEVPGYSVSEDDWSTGVVLENGPSQKNIETGLSDDSYTEVTSGLAQGDQIISKTITSSATKSSSSQTPSILGTGASKSSGTGALMRAQGVH